MKGLVPGGDSGEEFGVRDMCPLIGVPRLVRRRSKGGARRVGVAETRGFEDRSLRVQSPDVFFWFIS